MFSLPHPSTKARTRRGPHLRTPCAALPSFSAPGLHLIKTTTLRPLVEPIGRIARWKAKFRASWMLEVPALSFHRFSSLIAVHAELASSSGPGCLAAHAGLGGVRTRKLVSRARFDLFPLSYLSGNKPGPAISLPSIDNPSASPLDQATNVRHLSTSACGEAREA